MKFLNLDTGYSFDALWTESQQKGYVFWFPGEQSTNIIYTMPICVLSDSETIDISIENQDIFGLLNIEGSDAVTVDGYVFDAVFDDWSKYTSHNIVTVGESISSEFKYAHLFYVVAKSDLEGEYICKINIGSSGYYIRVGADFYNINEAAYINLANMGVEIPEIFQKAIYDTNVHEDYPDNILINRKFKELLSNYWDIIANRGSYKSMNNSLDWFEWGDALRLREIWKRDEGGVSMFDDREIMSIFEDKLSDATKNFIKTTYVSLYCALQHETGDYDSEYNPVLYDTVLKWSENDIQLKLALLSQFFGTFFLPIHMSVLHATVEDTVFTNTIKSVHASGIKRNDCFGSFDYIESNISDGQMFKLSNVRAQVTSDTIFGIRDGSSDYFGVDKFPTASMVSENDAYIFNSQYYAGPGVVIPIEFILANRNFDDVIKNTIVRVRYNNVDKLYTFNDIFRTFGRYDYIYDAATDKEVFTKIDDAISVKFNLLLKDAGDYDINFTFITGSSMTITRKLIFSVEDVDNVNINIYRVSAKDDSKGFTYDDFSKTGNFKYFYRIQPDCKDIYTQYLPYMKPDNPLYKDYKGIKLNRTVVMDVRNITDYDLLFLRGSFDIDEYGKGFLEFGKYDVNNQLTYLVFVSTMFYLDIPEWILNNYADRIVRNDLGFYPQFHDLILMNDPIENGVKRYSIDNYTISQYEAVCCAVEINEGNNKVLPFRYGHNIDIMSSEWSFINSSTGVNIVHPSSSQSPFIASNDNILPQGYYDIVFRYSLVDGDTCEETALSAFRIKNI